MSWQQRCVQRLRASQQESGGWPYQSSGEACAEPTALSCLALFATENQAPAADRGLRWLQGQQQSDGGVAVRPGPDQPRWTTALACLAFNQPYDFGGADFYHNRILAGRWLLANEGKAFKGNKFIYGHNTLLKGWSWVHGTHSWIEPTTYAIMALRAIGENQHPRTREAVKLLLDRAMSHGGWNYGNSKVFGSELRPFPAQTGMVLAALRSEPRNECISRGLAFLLEELPRIRTPFSLGWGLIGAAAWDATPQDAGLWLEECAERVHRRPVEPIADALLLLAESGRKNPFCNSEGRSRGV